MKEDFEQMSLDTRSDLDRAIAGVVTEAVDEVKEMTISCRVAPTPVRNRHEAYGIAAELLEAINKAVKAVKGDTGVLLATLPETSHAVSSIDATSSIANSMLSAATVLVKAAAEMKRVLQNLYTAETSGTYEPTPMEEMAVDPDAFEDADPDEADGLDEE